MTFEFDGERYKKASTHQKEWGTKLINEFAFKGNERILDLGCGDGALTAILADQVPDGSVLGIDASTGMIQTANKNFKKSNLKFAIIDINSINFSDEFDIILSNATLHWIKDHHTLLTHTYLALKTGGIVRFNFAGNGNCASFYKIVKRVMQSPDYSRYFEFFEWPWYMPRIDDYQVFAQSSGLSDIEVWEENADRYFRNQEEMTLWIDQPSIVPFLKCIPSKNDSKTFRDTVVKAMIDETLRPDGTCFETFRRINLKARKQ